MSTTIAVDPSLIHRVRAEFLEMPGLRLTSEQAERLWGLDRHTCEAILGYLTASHVLARSADGRFVAVASRP